MSASLRAWSCLARLAMGCTFVALSGCGSTRPEPARPVVLVETSDSGVNPDQLPEPTCDPEAEPGARCGPGDSRHCYRGRCMTQKDCSELCMTESRASLRVCIEQAREAGCAPGPCLDGASSRCEFDNRNEAATCASMHCGDDTLERQLKGQ